MAWWGSWFEAPDKASTPGDRRRSPRYSVPLDVRVITARHQALAADLSDICVQGVRVRMRRPLYWWQEPVALYVRRGHRERIIPIRVLRSEEGRDGAPMLAARFCTPDTEIMDLVGSARRVASC